jgi:hypothetical protein
MARLDAILFWLFLTLVVAGLGWAAFAIYKAFKWSDPRDDPDGLRMFLWACAALAGLVLAGMSAAYVLFPIVSHYFFHSAE